MQVMKVDYMSFEHPMSESDEDNSNHRDGYESPDFERPNQKVFCISTLHWRNSELTQVMHSLDKKATRRGSVSSTNMRVERHRTGIISSCSAPDNASTFASFFHLLIISVFLATLMLGSARAEFL